jgi:hypothetical protein
VRHLPVVGARQSTATAQAQPKPKSSCNLEKNMLPPLVLPMAKITETLLSLAQRWCSRLKQRVASLGTPSPSQPHKSPMARLLSVDRIDLPRCTHTLNDRHLTRLVLILAILFSFQLTTLLDDHDCPRVSPFCTARFQVLGPILKRNDLAHCGLWCARLQLSPQEASKDNHLRYLVCSFEMQQPQSLETGSPPLGVEFLWW